MAQKRQVSFFSSFYFRLLLVITLVAVGIWGYKTVFSNPYQDSVLGASTFIADGPVSQNGTTNMVNKGILPGGIISYPGGQQEPPGGIRNDNHNPQLTPSPLSRIRFEEQNHRQIMFNSDSSSIQISSVGGHLSIRGRDANGNETELNTDSLGKINEGLKGEGLEIATGSGSEFFLRQGTFSAQTHFPLSINPVTGQLTVTTPAGTKDVAVLPDQAVENLIRQKFINIVASSSADTGITLGQYASQSAYMVNGIAQKKLFGLLPVDINKTAYVSTQNGQILNITESFLSRLFDLLSTQ